MFHYHSAFLFYSHHSFLITLSMKGQMSLHAHTVLTSGKGPDIFCPRLSPAPSPPCFLNKPNLTEGSGIELVRVNIFCCVLENFDYFGSYRLFSFSKTRIYSQVLSCAKIYTLNICQRSDMCIRN